MRSLLAAALLFSSTTAFGATRVIPLAGHTPGANGTMWVTDLSLTNDGAEPAIVDLVFHSDAGTRSRRVSVTTWESLLLEDVVAPEHFPGTNPPAWLGQLEIRSTRTTVRASAHIFTTGATGGTYGTTYESVDPAVLPSSGVVAGLVSSDGFRSNVAFANPTAEPASYEYSLYGEDGALVATHRIDVPPHSTRQVGIHDAGRHLLTWTGNVAGYVTGSVIDNVSGDPARAPSVVRGATRLVFPLIGKTAGGYATHWSTSMGIASTADAPGEVTFIYRDAAGTYRKTMPLAARATIHAEDVLAFLGAPAGQGSLEVLGSVPLAGSVRVFHTREDGGTFGSSILPQEPFVRSDRVHIHNVRRDAGYRLNVAISNDTATAASGVVRLSPGAFPNRGIPVLLEETPFSLPAGSTMQLPLTADVRAGTVEVETENGVAVTVLASNVDNRTGDTIVREVEQENERQDDDHEIVMSVAAAAVDTPVRISLADLTDAENVFWILSDDVWGTFTWGTLEYPDPGEFEIRAEITLANGTVLHDLETVHIGDAPEGGPLGFTWSPADPQPGQEVTFTATGASGGDAYEWKFPDGVRKTGRIATFTFPIAGSFEVVLEREQAHVFRTVVVGSDSSREATAIDFSWSPATPRVLENARFVATLDGVLPPGSSVLWKMPDGSNLDGNTVIWPFTTPGTFEVEAVIMNGSVAGPSRRKVLTVAP